MHYDRRKGFAAEALRAVPEYLTAQKGIACMTAWCVSDNVASKRTLEKAGMRFQGVIQADLRPIDEDYGIE